MKGKAFLFSVGVIFTLVAPLGIQLLSGNTTATVVIAICGAFITLISRFDDLVEISLGPLRARMRETLNEATATIKQLRDLATATTQALLTDLMASNFMGGMPLESKLSLHDKLIHTLKDLGVAEAQIPILSLPGAMV